MIKLSYIKNKNFLDGYGLIESYATYEFIYYENIFEKHYVGNLDNEDLLYTKIEFGKEGQNDIKRHQY